MCPEMKRPNTESMVNRKTPLLFAALVALLPMSISGCASPKAGSSQLIVGDQGKWEPWEVLEASHPEAPSWVLSPPSGTFVAEGSSRKMRNAHRLASNQLILEAGNVAGVHVESKFLRQDTNTKSQAQSTTKLSVSQTVSVAVQQIYWERRQQEGIQLQLPTIKNEYRVLLLGKLSR
ncbi:MAG: hypothetical protein ACI8TQ_002474 [Planctomycetota bacterium]|jgi:hypothetical protein